jgi:hypothetical protein
VMIYSIALAFLFRRLGKSATTEGGSNSQAVS